MLCCINQSCNPFEEEHYGRSDEVLVFDNVVFVSWVRCMLILHSTYNYSIVKCKSNRRKVDVFHQKDGMFELRFCAITTKECGID